MAEQKIFEQYASVLKSAMKDAGINVVGIENKPRARKGASLQASIIVSGSDSDFEAAKGIAGRIRRNYRGCPFFLIRRTNNQGPLT